MKLTKPVYQAGKTHAKMQFNFADIKTKALNLSGMAWVDQRYGFIKAIASRFQVIVTDSDLIAHDDYIASLSKHQTVIVYVGNTPFSASAKRQRRAFEKLKAAGIKTIYRASEASMLTTLGKAG